MPPILALHNFSYAYPTHSPTAEPVWVLDGVDLAVQAGEFVAIMGPTGVGKTTLCLALNGIVPHSTGGTIGGEVWINGRNSRHHPVAELAQTVGLVFQEPETQLFNMTVEAEVAFGLETLGLPPAEMAQRIAWALELVGMGDFRQRSPFELSGGQKQRVAIAAILAMKPPVLVLDEPTANLDPIGKREVFAAVETLRQQEGITIIMVSHESEQIAAFADRVVVLDNGKVATDAPAATIFTPPTRLRQIGLSVPQLSELADCLNQRHATQFRFTQLDEAAQALIHWTFTAQGTDTPLPTPQPKVDHAPLLTLDSLSYAYDGTQAALNGIDLTIGAGEFVAIVGQNGSGKTTLVKHLNGLLRPTQGRVLLNGADIAATPVAALARTVGYVFQNPDHMIFSATVREEVAAGPRNLGLPEAEIAARTTAALRQFGLLPFAETQPALLGFGLRRKVSIAAVVAMQTAVLVLDEPTSGLDQRSTDELMAILTDLNRQGRTIVLITHDMRLVADHVPRCVVLHNGRLLADAPTRHIFQQPALLQQTQLEPPPIAQIGQRLGFPALTLRDLCA
ncbi:MAG: ATP-binding cassette domain-containing protein [Ardenticatenaceae bacterium]|nr:ATP-binding cassette domain-containing protein [Ardenticatenaceae bacterium]